MAQKVAAETGSHRTAIRFSPYGVFNDAEIFEDVEETYEYLASEMKKLELAYIHIVDHSSMGAPEVTESVKSKYEMLLEKPLLLAEDLIKIGLNRFLMKVKEIWLPLEDLIFPTQI
ncbi:MAG: hypothetical protein HC830_09340 [Bacteroidetes bacterium]|nr:hypothetical protein [Bacteroidota bacterium]